MAPVPISIMIEAGYAIIGHGLAGIVGNRADAAVVRVYKTIRDRIEGGDKSVTHDLQRIMLRSFIKALKSICSECLDDLKTDKKDFKKDIQWLNEKRKNFDKELKAVDKMKYVETPVKSLSEIEHFIMPNGLLDEEKIQRIKSKLIEKAVDKRDVPNCYKKKVEDTIFERMCAYFISEYRDNNKARDIFEGQVLMNIDMKLAGQQLSLDLLLSTLNTLALAKVPQIMEEIGEKLEKLDEKADKTYNEIKEFKSDMKVMMGMLLSRELHIKALTSLLPSALTEDEKKYLEHAEQIAKESEDEWSSLSIQGEIALLQGDYNTARVFLSKSLEIAESLKNERKLADSYYSIATLHLVLGEFKEGIEFLNQSIDLLKKLDDLSNLARAFNNLATTYQRQGELDKALDTFSLTQRMMKEGDYCGIAVTNLNVGRCYLMKGDYDIALEKYKESLNLLKKKLELITGDSVKDTRNRNYVKQSYVSTLCNIAYLDKIKGDYKSALEHYSESLKILEEISDRIGIARITGLMAEIPLIEGRYEEALRMLRDSLEVVEKSGNKREIAHAKGDVGSLYLHMEEFELAKGTLEESVKLFEEFGDKLHSRPAMHRLAIVYEHKGEVDKALKIHEEILEFSIRIGDQLGIANSKHQLGIIHQRKKEYDTALGLFEDVLRIAKQIGFKDLIARALHQIGIINEIKGDCSEAIERFQESLKISTELGNIEMIASTHSGIAFVYVHLRQYEKSIQEYQKSLEMMKKLGKKDSVIRSLLWIGDTYKKMGKPDKATSVYNEAVKSALEIKDNKWRAIVLTGIGVGFYEHGDYERAIQCFDKAIESNDKDVSAWNNKGATLDALGMYEEAIRMCDKALELHPNFPKALNGKGLALYHLHNSPTEAMEYYDKALKINPNSIEALCNKGNMLQELGKYEEAIQTYDKALNINSHYIPALGNKGNILFLMKKYAEALNCFEKIIEAHPQDRRALHRKGLCLCNMGVDYYYKKDYKKALNCLLVASIALGGVNAQEHKIVNDYIEKIRGEISNRED